MQIWLPLWESFQRERVSLVPDPPPVLPNHCVGSRMEVTDALGDKRCRFFQFLSAT